MTQVENNITSDKLKDSFIEFFRNFEDGPGNFKYREMIQDTTISNKFILYFLFEDLLKHNKFLATELADDTDNILEYAREAFDSIARLYNPKIKYEEEFFVRVSTNNNSLEIELEQLESKHLQKLSLIKGICIRASAIKHQVTEAAFQCPNCQTIISIDQNTTKQKMIEPQECPNPSCKNKKDIVVIEEESKFINYQTIKVQELPENLRPGRIPYSIKGVLTHDLADQVRPGERVSMMGIYKSTNDENRRGKSTTLFTPYVKILSIEGRAGDEAELAITTEEEIKIKELADKPNIQKIISNSIAPNLMGMDHLKLASALALFGGVRKVGESIMRGDIHVLFMGDPGTGKSQILKQCQKIAPTAIYTSGKGASAAGLTAAVVKEKDSNGNWTLEAGALVLADGGNALIDEFDKMTKADRTAIHEAMEQQTVSVTKAGIVATLNSKTSIIAAANPKKGRYSDFKTPTENINLSPTLLSRFDLIFIVRDKPDPDHDEKLAEFILSKHAGIEEKEIETDDKSKEEKTIIPHEFLKKYIKYAKQNCRPRLTVEAIKLIKKFYMEFRRRNSDDENAAIAVVARNLEGYVRISEAYAKMALRKHVTVKDVEEALKLARRSMEDTTFDPATGVMDADRVLTQKSSTKSKMEKFLKKVKTSMEENNGKAIDEEDFLDDFSMNNDQDRDRVEIFLNTLVDKGLIFRPKPGTIKLAPKTKKKK